MTRNPSRPRAARPGLHPGQADGIAPAAASGWRDGLLADYRSRAVAGLGEQAGLIHQDLLAEQAGRIAGAYQEAAGGARAATAAGLLASRSPMWNRRVPTDKTRRLAVLGPALRDALTSSGPVAEAMEHPDRALDRTLFSSAAQRVRCDPAPPPPSPHPLETRRQATPCRWPLPHHRPRPAAHPEACTPTRSLKAPTAAPPSTTSSPWHRLRT
ncbi:MAG: hypothetical protein WKF76_10340 [Nocardioidaceae bacterium]